MARSDPSLVPTAGEKKGRGHTRGGCRAPTRRRWALRAGLLCLAFVAGCTEYNDLYRKYGLDETRLILLVRYPQYLDTRIDLRKAPPGTGFLFGGRKRDFLLEELTQALRVSRPPEVSPAYALVFFPEDDVAYKTVVLDQYLNLLPGFRFLGQDYAGPYCEGPW